MDAIDVVIPAHNAPVSRLAAAVASGLALSASGRVVVVDDGSDEPVREADLADDPARLELLRHDAAKGPSAARNAGLDRASTPWIVMLDDDDTLVPEGVRAALALCERLSAGAAVVARDELHADRDVHRSVPPEWADRALPSPGDVFRPIRLFGATGVLVRRDLLADIQFDEELWIGEDRDFLRRLAARAPIAVSATTALRMTIRQDGNLSSAKHMERRVRDHVVLLERWWGEDSAAHLTDATRWLLKRAARVGVSQEAWKTLNASARTLGIQTPIKARVRRWMNAGAAP